eukprot:TRINITY_DN11671_c0_g1_i1.p1 TRINITY_DN11671_c0_g1~~TRINITY_DN11671_c0_g1_i1.p1  ORF type:complete len:158 (+),score=2.45 TRINITY_DN11671_c0_g1_i1:1831-2304(+)
MKVVLCDESADVGIPRGKRNPLASSNVVEQPVVCCLILQIAWTIFKKPLVELAYYDSALGMNVSERHATPQVHACKHVHIPAFACVQGFVDRCLGQVANPSAARVYATNCSAHINTRVWNGKVPFRWLQACLTCDRRSLTMVGLESEGTSMLWIPRQ